MEKNQTEATMPSIMTVDEAADYLRCHRSSVYRLLKARALPSFKIGSDYRFTRAALDAWIAKQEQAEGAR